MKIYEVYLDYFGETEDVSLHASKEGAEEAVKKYLDHLGEGEVFTDPNQGELLDGLREWDLGEMIVCIVEREVLP